MEICSERAKSVDDVFWMCLLSILEFHDSKFLCGHRLNAPLK